LKNWANHKQKNPVSLSISSALENCQLERMCFHLRLGKSPKILKGFLGKSKGSGSKSKGFGGKSEGCGGMSEGLQGNSDDSVGRERLFLLHNRTD